MTDSFSSPVVTLLVTSVSPSGKGIRAIGDDQKTVFFISISVHSLLHPAIFRTAFLPPFLKWETDVKSGTPVIKPIPYTQHQIVGLVEILQVVADMQECVAGYIYFERQDLVE